MKKKELTFLTVALILGAILGGLVGEIMGTFLPDGAVKILCTESFDIGFEPFAVKLYAINFTLGLLLKINFVSVICVLLVIAYYKWWYI